MKIWTTGEQVTASGLNTMNRVEGREGFLINGKIVPTVSSYNLNVAIKGMDGSDPSATNPVYVRINNSIRSITSALSLTYNAGTNWLNLGGSELATKEADLFVYLFWSDAGAIPCLAVSRISNICVAGDFNQTNTNEKGYLNSTWTGYAATDSGVVIGRFAASLTATATFRWSVPTFTSTNLIQRPIYESRWLDWTPTLTASGSMTITNPSITRAKYKVLDNGEVRVRGEVSGQTGGTANTGMLLTLPFVSADGGWTVVGTSYIYDGAETVGMIAMNNSTTILRGVKYNLANWALTAGATLRFIGSYAI